MKVTIVGAGAVGATTADNLIRREVAEEIILLDIKEGFAEGKAQDMSQTAALLGFDSKIIGVTNDYSATAGSTVAVITSGIPRKPGMTREELIGTNANIVKTVVDNLIKHSPEVIIIIVSNPMDTMTYLALKSSGLPKNRIIGMGGTLDSARFKYQLSQKLNASASDLNAIVVGGHGDTTMIPLIKHATWNSIPVTDFLTEEEQEEIIQKTMVGGATLTSLIGTSAWYAPGAATAAVVESIVRNQNKLFTASVFLDGEFGLSDINLGVPVIINKNGWDKIVPLKLSEEEKQKLHKSADAVRNMNNVLKDINVL
ncbi:MULTISPECIES: malate dehydrogenase [Sphingobacterium]|uniref:Malate dehydrogenase n=2 Tax=Sphingobacterium TaxID=28453 RepID=A0ABW5YW62_9SPHI|nr:MULTISPECIES: malate dehydrogenase [Sphingobacterium]MBB2953424.1 malate dehydrogenase [Sphingobacterium sp. JUb56]MCS3555004.1 malate dehydrogenase [Sphingobacterium sp. JUb21]MCW2262928.1 malate dehydrogenase [Sphingobacterium kitahiroshimense]NJI73874.1 malate dehydrogenase [Sphingobacterium sp. B16(2022)]TCR05599.1 malate dehydrogenase (NAD) [Sphingobacterium sp. JUb20]